MLFSIDDYLITSTWSIYALYQVHPNLSHKAEPFPISQMLANQTHLASSLGFTSSSDITIPLEPHQICTTNSIRCRWYQTGTALIVSPSSSSTPAAFFAIPASARQLAQQILQPQTFIKLLNPTNIGSILIRISPLDILKCAVCLPIPVLLLISTSSRCLALCYIRGSIGFRGRG